MSVKNKITRNSLICYFCIIAVFVTIKILSSLKLLNFLGTIGSYLVEAFIQIGLLFLLPIFFFSFLQKNKVKDTMNFYGFKKISFKAILIAIMMGIVVYILNVFVASFFKSILVAFGYNYGGSSVPTNYPIWLLFINILTTAFLPALCEETAHRGMLLKGLSAKGKMFAIVCSSLLFGLLHMNIEQFFYTTIIGLFAGYLALVCDTIYPAMIVHFMNNAISVLMGYSAANNLTFDFLFTWINQNLALSPMLGGLFVIFFIMTLCIFLKFLVKLLFRETALKRMNRLHSEIFRTIQRETFLQELAPQQEIPKNDENTFSYSFDEFDKLYHDKSFNLGYISKLDREIMSDRQPYKMDAVTAIFLVGCFILVLGITVFTFIWGIL